MNDLSQALATRETARIQHQEAAAALERARTIDAAAYAQGERLAGEEHAWVRRHARRLEEWTRAGSSGTPPSLVADAKHLQVKATADASARAAAHNLARFTAAETESRKALSVAEAAVDCAVRAVLTAEGDREAEEILREEAALEARRNKLRGLRELVLPTVLVRRAAPMEGDWMHIPMHELRASTPGSPRDRLNTPISQIGTAEVDPAAVEHWQARRASLLSGEELPPSSAPEERAA